MFRPLPSGLRSPTFIVLIVTIAFSAASCGGGAFFVSAGGTGLNAFFVSGTVSIVQFGFIDGVPVTFVTFIGDGTAHDMTFCGNMVPSFPQNVFVNVNFNPGTSCNNVVNIAVRG